MVVDDVELVLMGAMDYDKLSSLSVSSLQIAGPGVDDSGLTTVLGAHRGIVTWISAWTKVILSIVGVGIIAYRLGQAEILEPRCTTIDETSPSRRHVRTTWLDEFG